jgi:hypothetical protein
MYIYVLYLYRLDYFVYHKTEGMDCFSNIFLPSVVSLYWRRTYMVLWRKQKKLQVYMLYIDYKKITK